MNNLELNFILYYIRMISSISIHAEELLEKRLILKSKLDKLDSVEINFVMEYIQTIEKNLTEIKEKLNNGGERQL